MYHLAPGSRTLWEGSVGETRTFTACALSIPRGSFFRWTSPARLDGAAESNSVALVRHTTCRIPIANRGRVHPPPAREVGVDASVKDLSIDCGPVLAVYGPSEVAESTPEGIDASACKRGSYDEG